MKKIIIGLVTLLLTMQSCNVLDVDPTTQYSENTAYASLENLDLYVKGFYSIFYANADINVGSSCVMDDGATDLVKYSWYNVAGGVMNKYFYETNYVTPESNFRSNWSSMYTYIRQLNEYLYDLNKGNGAGLDQDQLAIRTAEVRFMRAFAYQELVIRHGGVILRIDENHVDDQNQKSKARSTESECWDFILGEYDKAAEVLPKSWTDTSSGNNIGRLTKGAAYGMKARAALYAKRYDVAIAACAKIKELVDEGYYQLLSGSTAADYMKIFTTNNNKELILPVNFQQGKKQHQYDNFFCPPYDYVAAGISAFIGAAAAPTDEYASSFDIKVGSDWKSFDWANLSSYTDGPWANRDPRFYASILYNGASWKNRTIELYEGGHDGFMNFSTSASNDNVHKSTTGYLFRKFMKDDTKINYTSILSDQYWIEMRLAEIYLIWSEALAKQDKFAEAYNYLNMVHTRAGLPELTQTNSWEDYLKDLSKERICELGLEGHRFFDLVRWGKAVSTLNDSRVHGVKITKTASGFSYATIECDTQDRYFPEKYTIYPIPYSEIKDNTLCEQNDLWK